MMVTATTTHHFAGVSCLTASSSNQRRINSNIYCKKHTVVTNGDRTVTAEERPKLNLKGNSGDSGIVAVNPKPQKGLAAKVIDFVEGLIVKFMHDSSRPLHYLSGNFGPVRHETPPTADLPVIGFLHVSSKWPAGFFCGYLFIYFNTHIAFALLSLLEHDIYTNFNLYFSVL